MFYCEDCAAERDWPFLGPKSRGPCEICHGVHNCADVPSSSLPLPGEEQLASRAAASVFLAPDEKTPEEMLAYAERWLAENPDAPLTERIPLMLVKLSELVEDDEDSAVLRGSISVDQLAEALGASKEEVVEALEEGSEPIGPTELEEFIDEGPDDEEED
jgi:hypothetical protein